MTQLPEQFFFVRLWIEADGHIPFIHTDDNPIQHDIVEVPTAVLRVTAIVEGPIIYGDAVRPKITVTPDNGLSVEGRRVIAQRNEIREG